MLLLYESMYTHKTRKNVSSTKLNIFLAFLPIYESQKEVYQLLSVLLITGMRTISFGLAANNKFPKNNIPSIFSPTNQKNNRRPKEEYNNAPDTTIVPSVNTATILFPSIRVDTNRFPRQHCNYEFPFLSFTRRRNLYFPRKKAFYLAFFLPLLPF